MHLQLLRERRLPPALGLVQSPRSHHKACGGLCHELTRPWLPGSLAGARGGLGQL